MDFLSSLFGFLYQCGDAFAFLVLAACLLGYWALLRFLPVPGSGVPGRDIPFMDQDRNLMAWLDRSLFPGRLYDGTRDPEDLIGNLPATGTTLLGGLLGGPQNARALRTPFSASGAPRRGACR